MNLNPSSNFLFWNFSARRFKQKDEFAPNYIQGVHYKQENTGRDVEDQ